MSQCICCKRESSHEEALLEVQTLHIRNYSGEQRIQALGSIVRSSVCDKCIETSDLPLRVPCAGAVLLGLFCAIQTIRVSMEQKNTCRS